MKTLEVKILTSCGTAWLPLETKMMEERELDRTIRQCANVNALVAGKGIQSPAVLIIARELTTLQS